jgi:hypothetical protein
MVSGQRINDEFSVRIQEQIAIFGVKVVDRARHALFFPSF